MTEAERIEKRATIRFRVSKTFAELCKHLSELHAIGAQDYIESVVKGDVTEMTFVKVEAFADPQVVQ